MRGPQYQRVLLKLSGESLLAEHSNGVNYPAIVKLIQEIRLVVDVGVQVAVVIGGGNWFRGRNHSSLTRVTADRVGMLATVMNGLLLRDCFQQQNLPCKVYSAFAIAGMIKGIDTEEAIAALETGHVVIFAGGTGNPLVTTDSAASLRAVEVKAQLLIKATNVEGVYSADPKQYPDATLLKKLHFDEVLTKAYGVMDLAAFWQCRDNNIPIQVYHFEKQRALQRIVYNEPEGTYIGSDVT